MLTLIPIYGGGFVDHARPVPTALPHTYAIKKFQN